MHWHDSSLSFYFHRLITNHCTYLKVIRYFIDHTYVDSSIFADLAVNVRLDAASYVCDDY